MKKIKDKEFDSYFQKSNPNKTENKIGMSFTIPDKLKYKYKGCGHGVIVLNKRGNIEDMWYSESIDSKPLKDQNVDMIPLRDIDFKYKEGKLLLFGNFSCWSCCWF